MITKLAPMVVSAKPHKTVIERNYRACEKDKVIIIIAMRGKFPKSTW